MLLHVLFKLCYFLKAFSANNTKHPLQRFTILFSHACWHGSFSRVLQAQWWDSFWLGLLEVLLPAVLPHFPHCPRPSFFVSPPHQSLPSLQPCPSRLSLPSPPRPNPQARPQALPPPSPLSWAFPEACPAHVSIVLKKMYNNHVNQSIRTFNRTKVLKKSIETTMENTALKQQQ